MYQVWLGKKIHTTLSEEAGKQNSLLAEMKLLVYHIRNKTIWNKSHLKEEKKIPLSNL